jgi:hypothetical protein
MARLGVTLPSLSNTIPEIAEMARLAEDAGPGHQPVVAGPR